MRVGASIGDIIAGMYLTQGVLAAFLTAQKPGLAQRSISRCWMRKSPFRTRAGHHRGNGQAPIPTARGIRRSAVFHLSRRGWFS